MGTHYETCITEADLIISCGGNDPIRQQYRDGSRAAGTGCVRTARCLRRACICAAVHFIFYFPAAARSLWVTKVGVKREMLINLQIYAKVLLILS